ncbi:MAG: site-specific integrase [Proteobacteria bacterium]|nr:site-specific integrase [Pseudomonadota bacterium]
MSKKKKYPKGVRPRRKAIEIGFPFDGEWCRETIKLPPTPANIKYAERRRGEILMRIGRGVFDYAKEFPDSVRAITLGQTCPTTIADLLNAYIKRTRNALAYSTWVDYKNSINNHLIPAFGDYRVGDLKVSHLRDWIMASVASNKRINNVLTPLRTVMVEALLDELIEFNPFDKLPGLSRMRGTTKTAYEVDPLSPDEVAKVLAVMGPQIQNLFQFAFWSGLRTGELIALQWRDIDWDRGMVRVRKSSTRKKIKAPKTNAGLRDVKLLTPAREALTAQKAHTFLQGECVFMNPRTGEPWLHDGQIRKTAWQPAVRKARIRYRNPYQTRHTYASTLLSAGEDPMWVAQQMGHRDWGVIRSVYGRWIPEARPDAGNKAEALFVVPKDKKEGTEQ